MGYKQYCKDYEKIENYEKAKADNFKGWHCHHRLETHNSDGERRLVDITVDELKALGMYYHRPPEELIFLTISEHSAYNKGNKNALGCKHSEETKKKMREAKIGKNTWSKGTHWYNNGKINTMSKECPPGFVPGMLKRK